MHGYAHILFLTLGGTCAGQAGLLHTFQIELQLLHTLRLLFPRFIHCYLDNVGTATQASRRCVLFPLYCRRYGRTFIELCTALILSWDFVLTVWSCVRWCNGIQPLSPVGTSVIGAGSPSTGSLPRCCHAFSRLLLSPFRWCSLICCNLRCFFTVTCNSGCCCHHSDGAVLFVAFNPSFILPVTLLRANNPFDLFDRTFFLIENSVFLGYLSGASSIWDCELIHDSI